MTDIGAIASENTNLTAGASASSMDHSYWPYPGQKPADGSDSAVMSFNDFLDMINPLEHIPVISSVYRALTDQTINPVSRIVGDTLYSGPLGLVSAGLSAIGAIGDEAFAANNGGHGAASTVVAALFGNENASASTTSIKLANTEPTSPQPDPSASEIASQTPLLAPAAPLVASATAPAPTPRSAFLTAPGNNSSANSGMPLDRSKMPYGGVMDSSMLANAQQNQTLALAMAGQQGALQAQRTLRSNRFATSTAAPSPTQQVGPVAPSVPAIQPEPQTQAAMQNLVSQLQAMKAISQYKNAAQITPIPGTGVNISN